ncbi:sugar lactone lactonase YvrE [Knoellia remsis]|uniref:Sugar lactone lactonase YvrE n=1 Tax=Knoellia remsis TaxID=407159 RepID=A0A2T0V0Y4_9MICO|nr:SMP-30/gluconolactonase/LRE family protein [Knoellia remsis]PRY63845.1 sugar lactone lactonase YvrE [Knoellia remsis]
MTTRARLLGNDRRFTGEGAFWDGDGLLWVDIWAGHVLRTDRSGRTEILWVTMPPVGFAVAVVDGLLVGAGLDIVHVGAGGARRVVEVTGAAPDSRLNDGAIDAAGRLWFGTVTPRGTDSSVFRYAAERLDLVWSGLEVANGMDWSPDGEVMYVADTGTGVVHWARHDPATGEVGALEEWAARAPGAPDGLCVAPDGGLWLAEIFTGSVVELVAGEVRRTVTVDCPRVTSVACASGPGDPLELWITTGRKDLTPEQLRKHPESGSLFVARPDGA